MAFSGRHCDQKVCLRPKNVTFKNFMCKRCIYSYKTQFF